MPDTLDIRRKHRIRRLLYSKGSLFILLVLLILSGRATWGMYHNAKEAREKQQEIERELRELEARKTALQEEIDHLSTQEGIEEELRERFMIAKEGEEVSIIIEEGIPEESGGEKKDDRPWWKKLFSW